MKDIVTRKLGRRLSNVSVHLVKVHVCFFVVFLQYALIKAPLELTAYPVALDVHSLSSRSRCISIRAADVTGRAVDSAGVGMWGGLSWVFRREFPGNLMVGWGLLTGPVDMGGMMLRLHNSFRGPQNCFNFF